MAAGDIIKLIDKADFNRVFVNVADYPSLNACVASVSGSNNTILIASSTVLTGHLVVPNSIEILITKAGSINQYAYNLTINGNFSCGLYQAFFGSGTTTFNNSNIDFVYPQWWGAKGDGVTDDTSAVYKSITCGVPLNGNNNIYYVTAQTLSSISVTKYFPVTTSISNITFKILSNQMPDGTRFEIVGNNVVIENSTFCEINNILTRSNVYGTISANNVGNFTLNNVTVSGSNGVGIHIRCNSTNFKIINPIVRNTKADGIHIQRGSQNFTIINPNIAFVEDDAISVVGHGRNEGYSRPGFGSIIGGNIGSQTSSAVGSGIALVGCTDVNVVSPTIKDTGLSGIRITDYYDVSEGNYTVQNINVDSPIISNTGLTSNNSNGLVKDGISIYNSSNVTINNAKIENIQYGNGIAISNSNIDTHISNLNITNVKYRGLVVPATTNSVSSTMELWRNDPRKGSATTVENHFMQLNNINISQSGTDGFYIDGGVSGYIKNAIIKNINVSNSNTSSSNNIYGIFVSGIQNSIVDTFSGGLSASVSAISTFGIGSTIINSTFQRSFEELPSNIIPYDTVNSKRHFWWSTYPSSPTGIGGGYKVGDIIHNWNPAAGTIYWICTIAGDPGTWVAK